MNEAMIKKTLAFMAEAGVPADLNGWPQIQARIATVPPYEISKRHSIMNGENKMDPQMARPRNLRIALISGLITIFVLAGLLVTPQGRALAQSVMHFFTRTTTDIIPGPTEAAQKWVIQTPGVPAATLTPLPTQPGPAFEAECGGFAAPKCTIEEIRSKVHFPVLQIAQIPDGFYFVGVTGGQDGIYLTYEAKNQGGALNITEIPWSGSLSQKPWEVGASAEIQAMKIGDVTGEYVKGSYDGNHTPAVWNPNLDVQNLRWVNGGVLFTLMKIGSEPQMDREALAVLAGNLTTGPVSGVPTPISTLTPTSITPTPDQILYQFNLTIEQAGQKAEFKVQAPGFLPEILTFKGASFDPSSSQYGKRERKVII